MGHVYMFAMFICLFLYIIYAAYMQINANACSDIHQKLLVIVILISLELLDHFDGFSEL